MYVVLVDAHTEGPTSHNDLDLTVHKLLLQQLPRLLRHGGVIELGPNPAVIQVIGNGLRVVISVAVYDNGPHLPETCSS